MVSEWKKFANDRKTIVSARRLRTAKEMARQFNAAGVMAACFTSDTSEVERAALLGEYRKPDSALRVLLSVSAFIGFDARCRVRLRRAPAAQEPEQGDPDGGRGLRSSPGTSKDRPAFCSTFPGNIVRMAEDYSDIFYNGLDALDAGERSRQDDSSRQRRKPEGKAQFADTSRWASAVFPVDTEVIKPSLVEHEPARCRKIRIGKTEICRRQAPSVEQRHARMHAGIRRLISSKESKAHLPRHHRRMAR